MRRALNDGAWLDLRPAWLDACEAERAFELLRTELRWEQREIILFGKAVLQPRLIAWAGALPYRYSGQTLEPRPATLFTRELLERVIQTTGSSFNHVLINRYRNGEDSMGMHSDSEPELGRDPVVATLSLGATRSFQLGGRVPIPPASATPPTRAQTLRFELTSGSLLTMGGTCQRDYRHGIPKTKKPIGERISLTFRQILTEK